MSHIFALKILDKNNKPIFSHLFQQSPEERLQFDFLAHSALDILLERVKKVKDMYLGLLFPSGNYRIFGFMSNTNIKLLLTTSDNDTKDGEYKILLQKMYSAYVDTIMNPFHQSESLNTDSRFIEKLEKFVNATAWKN